ncbi:L-ornithine N5-oxygenase SidA [Diplocarpon rosae]|nr:L-ornithine N5-oxygenase SidA [Diplocarpon rosae]
MYEYDLLCIGFGPASLALAVALCDRSSSAKVCFLERQPRFAWHAGMQLSGAKMQISFLKDLATPRNPQSHFTFLHYLFCQKRLHHFINLDTFTPSRLEYEDYLRWCAGHFAEHVAYGQDVLSVDPDGHEGSGHEGAGHETADQRHDETDRHDHHPERTGSAKPKVTRFQVISRDVVSGEFTTRVARHVVIAVGGRGRIPAELPPTHPRVVHSSRYVQQVATALPSPAAAYHVAVVGSGQSAAEIFNDLPTRYPHARKLYMQRVQREDPDGWPLRIQTRRRVAKVIEREGKLVLRLERVREGKGEGGGEKAEKEEEEKEEEKEEKKEKKEKKREKNRREREARREEEKEQQQQEEEELAVDAVFVATGYEQTAYEDLLLNTRALLTAQDRHDGQTVFPVRRDYKIAFDESKVAANTGIWLQGCNEKTHGLSDTLLSILAVRAGELVQSIFGTEAAQPSLRAKL